MKRGMNIIETIPTFAVSSVPLVVAFAGLSRSQPTQTQYFQAALAFSTGRDNVLLQ